MGNIKGWTSLKIEKMIISTKLKQPLLRSVNWGFIASKLLLTFSRQGEQELGVYLQLMIFSEILYNLLKRFCGELELSGMPLVFIRFLPLWRLCFQALLIYSSLNFVNLEEMLFPKRRVVFNAKPLTSQSECLICTIFNIVLVLPFVL